MPGPYNPGSVGEGEKPLQEVVERQRRLPAPVLSDGERLVRLAIAVDDDERDLLELGVANALAEGLVAFVDLHAEAFGREPVSEYAPLLTMGLSDRNLSLIHISEPTRRTPISYAVFCLKKKKT